MRKEPYDSPEVEILDIGIESTIIMLSGGTDGIPGPTVPITDIPIIF